MYSSKLILIIIVGLISNTAPAGQANFSAGALYTGNLVSIIEEITGENPYLAFEIDFDGDSKNELVVGILCGNAGCENLIFRRLGHEKYEYVTRVFFHNKAFQLVQNSKSEFSDIHLYRRSNASTGCLILLKYEKDKYREASRECGSSDLFYKIKTESIIDVEL